MNFQSLLKPFAFIGMLTLLAGVTFGAVYGVREVRDPRLPDAFDHSLFNECVGTSQIFSYKLKNGDVEITYITDARQCGGSGNGTISIIQEGEGIVAGEGADEKK